MSNSEAGDRGSERIRRLKKDEIRSRLLRSAARIFSSKGFDRTTLEEIAEDAGFSKGAVYSNFDSKDELFFCLIERQIDERIRAMEDIPASGGSVVDVAKRRAELLIDIVASDPEWQILFIEYWLRAVRNPALLERFVVRRRMMREKITRHLESSAIFQRDKEAMPAASYAVLLLALSNGLGIEGIIDPETVTKDFTLRLLTLLP